MDIKIEVESIVDHRDGTVTLELLLNEEARELLISEGLKSVLAKTLGEN